MSANGGAWGIALWQDGRDFPGQENGISLEGGDPIVPYLPTEPLGCLLLPPDGMGVPPVRSGDVAFAQRDGVVQFGDYYEPRILTFQVSICNEGCPGCVPAGSPGAPPETSRQKVKRLTTEWSRTCTGATLVIFSDCHDPAATEEQKTHLGPYLVHGRPRGAAVTWHRSNRGCADITLRFDAQDARLLLATIPDGDVWTAQHCVELAANGPAEEVEVVGDFCAFATYTLTGELTAPIEVTFEDEDAVVSSFEYGDDIAMGDTVTVDTKWGIAESGNVETTQFLTGDSQTPLPPGTNLINVTTGDPGDTGTVTVCWENAVVSG